VDSSRRIAAPRHANPSSWDLIKYVPKVNYSILTPWYARRYAQAREGSFTLIRYWGCQSVARRDHMPMTSARRQLRSSWGNAKGKP
jgi:hypothetical protein